MNLFLISLNVEEAAQGLCDQLCVKMILESVQLLYSVFHMRVGTPKVQTLARKYGLVAYKLTHKFHPIVIWARKKKEHYKFLVNYTMALLEEYNYRFGKNHACLQHMRMFQQLKFPKRVVPKEWPKKAKKSRKGVAGRMRFPLCMPEEFHVKRDGRDDVGESYRKFLNHKPYVMRFSSRPPPAWLTKTVKLR